MRDKSILNARRRAERCLEGNRRCPSCQRGCWAGRGAPEVPRTPEIDLARSERSQLLRCPSPQGKASVRVVKASTPLASGRATPASRGPCPWLRPHVARVPLPPAGAGGVPSEEGPRKGQVAEALLCAEGGAPRAAPQLATGSGSGQVCCTWGSCRTWRTIKNCASLMQVQRESCTTRQYGSCAPHASEVPRHLLAPPV